MNKLQSQIYGLEVLIEKDHRGVRVKIVAPGFDIFNESIAQFASFGCETVLGLYENLVKNTECTSGFIALRLVPASEQIPHKFPENNQETFVEATMMAVPRAQYLPIGAFRDLVQLAYENYANRPSSPKCWLFRPEGIDTAPNLSANEEKRKVMQLEEQFTKTMVNKASISGTTFQEQLNGLGLDSTENYTYKCLWLYNWEAYQLLQWYFDIVKEKEVDPVLFGIPDFQIHTAEDEKKHLQAWNQKLDALDKEQNTITGLHPSVHNTFLAKQFQFEKALENIGFFDGLFPEEKLMRLSDWGCKCLYLYLKAVIHLQKQLRITVPLKNGLELFQSHALFPDVLRSKTNPSTHQVPISILKITLDTTKNIEYNLLGYHLAIEDFERDKFLVRWQQGPYKKWMKSEIHKISEPDFRHLPELVLLDKRIGKLYKTCLYEGKQNILKTLEERIQLISMITGVTWIATKESLAVTRKFRLLYLTNYLESWLLFEKEHKLNEKQTGKLGYEHFLFTKDWLIFNKNIKSGILFQWAENIEAAIKDRKAEPYREKYYINVSKQDLVIYGKWMDNKFHLCYVENI